MLFSRIPHTHVYACFLSLSFLVVHSNRLRAITVILLKITRRNQKRLNLKLKNYQSNESSGNKTKKVSFYENVSSAHDAPCSSSDNRSSFLGCIKSINSIQEFQPPSIHSLNSPAYGQNSDQLIPVEDQLEDNPEDTHYKSIARKIFGIL